MAFHHVAIATKDLDATHRFYTEAMGFELAKVEAAPTPDSGWARHLFYDTGDGTMLAVWDLHVPSLEGFRTEISTGLGLPPWVNHVAFNSPDLEDLDLRLKRWIDQDLECVRIDHGWCTSIYTNDPNGITVEFCSSTRELTADDRTEALELLRAAKPALADPPADIEFFTANA
jgi:catechol 2,3-dioxygenase-like lactoylglutathione lyase family enzyme